MWDKPKEAEKPAPKVNDTATDPDTLRKVKTTLQCATHAGPNRWCYVRRDKGHEGEHVALRTHEVSLWARKIVRCFTSLILVNNSLCGHIA
jgi:hypothetical protein